jgi:arsenate reductase
MNFYSDLQVYVSTLMEEEQLIPPARQQALAKLASYINDKPKGSSIALNFICTHNSRRSHLAQIWTAVAAAFYGLDHINTFSGGTEATAFNPRAVAAMMRAGFKIENPGGKNPHYQVAYGEAAPTLECFSKVYDNPFNPTDNFAAIMTCSDADENCPFIPGAEMRLALTYEDPKAADDTPEEAQRYDERVRQIGREIFYAMRWVG